ncbi:MAG: hypothetical protein WC710_13565 [Gallionella sp.]|jgi:hypothetical protein
MNPIDRIAQESEALLRLDNDVSIQEHIRIVFRDHCSKLREAIAEGQRLQKLVDELSQENVK